VKWLLLAVMMLASIAPASATQVTLPDIITGEWCVNEDTHPVSYTRSEDCPSYRLVIRKDGYSEMWDECVFDKIEQETHVSYLVHARCEAQAEGGGGGTGHF
jgi:hypothetical protein